MKPFAEACEQNKFPILEVLKQQFADCKYILELGSGTGQHAVFFAKSIPIRKMCIVDLLVEVEMVGRASVVTWHLGAGNREFHIIR